MDCLQLYSKRNHQITPALGLCKGCCVKGCRHVCHESHVSRVASLYLMEQPIVSVSLLSAHISGPGLRAHCNRNIYRLLQKILSIIYNFLPYVLLSNFSRRSIHYNRGLQGPLLIAKRLIFSILLTFGTDAMRTPDPNCMHHV